MTYKRIDLAYVRSLVRYDSASGLLFWDSDRGKKKKGDIAGTNTGKGYIAVGIGGSTFLAHRLAWAIHNDVETFEQIDHIDGNRGNNRIENLRICLPYQNSQNKGEYKFKNGSKKSSSFTGVHWDEPNKRWIAQIGFMWKRFYLGSFKKEEDAAKAYLEAKDKIHKFNPKTER